MRIVIASDKFKGSLDASEVASFLAEGVHSVDDTVVVDRVPVADGGEGTLDAALGAGFEPRIVRVTGPTGQPVEAAFAVRGDEAVIEMALASGLAVLPSGVTDAAGATSRGTGELIAAALDAGATRIVLGVGGSATTDGGAGLIQGLGARLLGADGADLPDGGEALAGLAAVDLSALDARIAGTRFVLASDVDNPLLGPSGAAAVFGPQKGADAATVAALDVALAHYAGLLSAALGDAAARAVSSPGAGAAGGVGFAALAVLGAERRPGIDVVLEFAGLDERIAGADLVITGEGSLDEQSFGGKTPIGVARAAAAASVPVIAVCGRTTLSSARLREAGFERTLALTDLEPDADVCMRAPGRILRRIGALVAADLGAHVRH
ncbi:glycerate kinase [Agromyces sp. NPDC058484]|uniref:glycerate kinase n=1 Tax=Agromyces sp. NPDC058484 TaxID=3346524 RepID=UPI00364AC101